MFTIKKLAHLQLKVNLFCYRNNIFKKPYLATTFSSMMERFDLTISSKKSVIFKRYETNPTNI